jgi:hypothetical protein
MPFFWIRPLNLPFLLFTFNNTVSIRLGIIGGGVMAEAILSRLLKKNIYSPETVLVGEPQSQRRNFWVNTYGVQVSEDNREAARATEVLILAIKPQILEQVVNSLLGIPEKPLIISILAGVTLNRLEMGQRYFCRGRFGGGSSRGSDGRGNGIIGIGPSICGPDGGSFKRWWCSGWITASDRFSIGLRNGFRDGNPIKRIGHTPWRIKGSRH